MSLPSVELIFPPFLLVELADVRGTLWKELVNNSNHVNHASPEQIALTLMLAKMSGCATCTTSSYRAIQGCKSCAKQTLKRYRGSDEELVTLYQSAYKEVVDYLENKSSMESRRKILSER